MRQNVLQDAGLASLPVLRMLLPHLSSPPTSPEAPPHSVPAAEPGGNVSQGNKCRWGGHLLDPSACSSPARSKFLVLHWIKNIFRWSCLVHHLRGKTWGEMDSMEKDQPKADPPSAVFLAPHGQRFFFAPILRRHMRKHRAIQAPALSHSEIRRWLHLQIFNIISF